MAAAADCRDTLLPARDDAEVAEVSAAARQGSSRQLGPQEPRRLLSRKFLCTAGLALTVAAAAALGLARGQAAPALLDALAIARKAEADSSKDEEEDKGCCSYGGHTKCEKPWEGCVTGLGGACCSGAPLKSIKQCEKCKGQWIILPQNTCEKGHSIEKPLPHIWDYSKHGKKSLRVKILSYNLFWWHLFVKNHGEGGKAGHLIKKDAKDMPFDILAFQECQNPWHVLFDSGLDKTFKPWHSNQNICLAYRKTAWEELERGEKIVAVDGNVPGQNFGQRSGMWLRLKHKETGETVFFMNHHGPLPLSSGGQWGGATTAYNLLHLVKEHATEGEAVIIVGDFNSVATSQTVVQMGCGIRKVFSGTKFGGVDHIFSNVDKAQVAKTELIGQGGSDHDAISAVFNLGPQDD